MIARLRGLLLAATAAALALPASVSAQGGDAPRTAVDLELVIAADVSNSIDMREAFLQRKGISESFRSPEVVRAIRLGARKRIGVVYFEFSSRIYNRVIVDWRVIDSEESATNFANALMGVRVTRGQGTSISDAIEFGMDLLEKNSFDGEKRTIDISGDGPNNRGRPVLVVRDEASAKGITINGLPIIDPYGGDQSEDLDRYFVTCVIAGRSSFIQVANGFEDFARAMRRKLVMEISAIQPEPDARIIRVAQPGLLRQELAPRPELLDESACLNRQGF